MMGVNDSGFPRARPAKGRCSGAWRLDAVEIHLCMHWVEQRGRDVSLRIKVIPRAKTTTVQGEHGDALKIRLKSPPVDGKANSELIRFLSDALGVKRSTVVLEAGLTSRVKRVHVSECTVDEVIVALSPAP